MSRNARALGELREAFRYLPPVVREAIVEFARKSGIVDEPPDRIFEHFATYHVLQCAGLDEFDITAALVAGEHDTQLDAAAITINGELVTDVETVDRLLKEAIDGEPFEVRFLFAQATMSAKFPSDKVALFTAGILNFFLPQTKLRQSESLIRVRTFKDKVLAALETLGHAAPTADVFVVWPGTWTTEGHSEHATGVAEAALDTLKATKLVSAVHFHRVDSTRLQSLIVDDAVNNKGEITLTGMVELPPVDGVSFGCIGFVPALDYLACLVGGDPKAKTAQLKDDVFHGNVRAFLGIEERVNRHIRESIAADDGGAQGEFALRNNGVTIIAHGAERIVGSNTLKLTNFQVVNGCQTSHVLFHARHELKPSLQVPIKITATRNAEIAQNIILGLNRQTQIDELQILSRNDFVRRLKRHLDVASAPQPLWINKLRTPMILFERRTGEFRHIPEVHWARIVTMQEMMQAYAAAFLEAPHAVHEGGKSYLIRQVPARMFGDDHDVGFYFAAGLLLWRARLAFPTAKDWQAFPAKHHLVFALRTLADPSHGCPTGRRDGEAHEYLMAIRVTLTDDKRASALAADAWTIVLEAARRHKPSAHEAGIDAQQDPTAIRPTSRMAQRETFSDQVLTLCLEARAARGKG